MQYKWVLNPKMRCFSCCYNGRSGRLPKQLFYGELTTVESQFNDLRFDDIPGVTINIRFPGKSYSKMYGTEPQFNDLG